MPKLKTCRPMSRAAIEAEAGGCQNGHMVIVSGKVVDGRVEVDSELSEGASLGRRADGDRHGATERGTSVRTILAEVPADR